MWELARRNMLRERTRLAISVAGVAFAVLLMLSLSGVYNSYQTRIAGYFGGVQADLWIVQSGTSNFFHSSSVLPADGATRLQAVPGVEDVRAYVGRQIGFSVDGRELVTYAVGVPPGGEVGGSIGMTRGSSRPGPGEIVVDEVLAESAGLSVGSSLTLRDRTLEVVGLSRGGDMVMYQYSFVSLEEALALQGDPSIVNFFLVDLAAGADRGVVATEVSRALRGIEAWTPARVVRENQAVIEDSFLPVIAVLLAIGFVVGAAVIGLTTYSAVLEKRREYGVLKALGADSWAMLRAILIQSGIAGTAGYVVGVGASLAVARWVPAAVPQFAVDLDARHVAWVLAAVGGMVLVSILPPLRRLARIDPAEVFRG